MTGELQLNLNLTAQNPSWSESSSRVQQGQGELTDTTLREGGFGGAQEELAGQDQTIQGIFTSPHLGFSPSQLPEGGAGLGCGSAKVQL